MNGEGAFVRYNNIGKSGAGEVSVTVVIPVYRTALTAGEEQSLEQCCRVLSAYPKVLVKPCGLDVSALLTKMQSYEPSADKAPAVEEFDAAYFESVADYDRLLLSAAFYERFLTTRYILNYQLDAYVFRDELEEWCTKGYAYVSAPFMLRSLLLQLRLGKGLWRQTLSVLAFRSRRAAAAENATLRVRLSRGIAGERCGRYARRRDCSCAQWKRMLLYYRMCTGGGLSLRQTAVFYELASRWAERFAERWAAGTLLPEDIVWNGLLARSGYRLPSFRKRLSFAFDTNPRLCYWLCGRTLPFGCHSWIQRRRLGFWQRCIPPSRRGR